MTRSDSPSLEKYREDPDGLDFSGLRKAGIEFLQELSGEIWSDYNLHDPGVTMLEQLCYGLTDLVYRSRFAPEDYLFGADGRIDGPRHALLPPEEVLPSAPLTLPDYQKLLADALPEIRNVWVSPATDTVLPGLLDIHLQLADTVEPGSAKAQALLHKAADLYHRHRNLCEDLGEIRVVGQIPYRLSGEIEIDNSRPPAEILADIYFACTTAVSPPIPQQPYHDLADEELDRLFDGPLTPHGRIDGESLRHWNGASLSELVRAVGGINGVTRITSLALVDEEGRSRPAATGDPATKRVPHLVIPRRTSEQAIKLRKAGQVMEIPAADFLDRLDRLDFTAQSRRHGRLEHEPISPLPTGTAGDFGQYTSVQYHFPPVYGIGAYGLPASAPPARKAQARQLQAYLLLFEQLMIDFQQGLEALPQLFSTDDAADRTYFYRMLDDSGLPGVERLYRTGKADADAALDKTLSRLDDIGDRRFRALDFLLALHGEKFDQRILRNFISGSVPLVEARLVRAKAAFLRRAPHINARRMGAFDYRRPPGPDNVPAMAEKVALLLDLPAKYGKAATGGLRARGYRHLRDDEFLREAGLKSAAEPEGAEEVFPLAENPSPGGESILARQLLCPALLNWGSDLGRYRVVAENGEAAAFALYFASGGTSGHWRLSRHPDKRAAVAEANRLARFIGALATQTLGFHLVEHILLRPADRSPQPADIDFHAFRISAILPAWSPRLANPEFRKLAEQTIARCCPAHLSTDVLWLDFEAMAVFEHLHGEWLRHKSDRGADPGSVDRTARALALFLQRQAPKSGQGTRWL